MQVRLTKEGQKVLGFHPDRKVANVSNERAFALMSRGYAAQDKGFMALFDGPIPEKPVEKVIEKPKPIKTETAISRIAEKREKSIRK